MHGVSSVPETLTVLARLQWTYAAAGVGALWLHPVLSVPVLMLCALVLSAGAHELGHAAAYWASVGPGTLQLRSWAGVPLAVTTPTGASSRLVAAAGPGLPAALGAGLGLLAWATGQLPLACAALAFGLHGLGLLPGNHDGDLVWALR